MISLFIIIVLWGELGYLLIVDVCNSEANNWHAEICNVFNVCLVDLTFVQRYLVRFSGSG
jgi:hypothetical protein